MLMNALNHLAGLAKKALDVPEVVLTPVVPLARVAQAIAQDTFGRDTFVRTTGEPVPTRTPGPVILAPATPAPEAVMADLRAGRTDDAARSRIAACFGPAGLAESHALMEQIRREGLLDTFLDATLRDEHGQSVAPELKEAVKLMMETGRLDVYAETLATVSLNHYDPASGRFNGHTCYSPADQGVYFNHLGDPAEMAKTMAHETFHAYNDAHGADGRGPGVTDCLNEGFGIAAIKHAFEPDAPYNLAEMVYGTKNWYRDKGVAGHDSDKPVGDATNADAELTAFLETLASGDRSQLAWQSPAQLESDYQTYFAPLDRNDAHWFEKAEEATVLMRAAR